MANSFLIQVDSVTETGPEQIILAFGQATPPVVLGTDEEKLAQLERVSHVPVKVLARFSLTPSRVAELIQLLQGVATTFGSSRAKPEELAS